mmetsp:Transcript_7/g.13  ORF Transcript_7/g.13 Transcript_7/m.13 type:complete len:247 (-) Transcript_7:1240-1980(-)
MVGVWSSSNHLPLNILLHHDTNSNQMINTMAKHSRRFSGLESIDSKFCCDSNQQKNVVPVNYMARSERALLPFEGVLYDKLTLSNFVDLEAKKLGFSISKSAKTDALSELFTVELPTKVQLMYKFGTLWTDGWKSLMRARLSVNVRLLNLSGEGRSNTGAMLLKWSKRSDGYVSYGWEIERKMMVWNRTNTRLYGKVAHSTNSRLRAKWRLSSVFGVEQTVKLFGFRLTIRAGLTPEGKFESSFRI